MDNKEMFQELLIVKKKEVFNILSGFNLSNAELIEFYEYVRNASCDDFPDMTIARWNYISDKIVFLGFIRFKYNR